MEHPDLLEGYARFSDAGVFRLRPDLAIVQTVDFFPPLVDDPRDFGRIAAANALSDVYAMAGVPVTALSVAGFPANRLDVGILGDIFAGGAEKVLEAGAVIAGGHTVEDREIKFGLAVTGTVHPDRFVSNAGARPGELLVLTKPLGMGSVTTAFKQKKVDEPTLREAINIMTCLNRDASQLMVELGVRGATDITGFGLIGHAFEMATSSGVTLRIDPARVPVFPPALHFARRGLLSGGARRNRNHLGASVLVAARPESALEKLLFDAETSGGLLVALPPDRARTYVARLEEKGHTDARIVGEVATRGTHAVELAAVGLGD